MATKTSQQSSSSPLLSRLGVGLGLKSQLSPTYQPASRDQDEEDWYIAYNGPYEVPKDTRKRDSWGDIVEEEGRDAILDADLLHRYGGSSKQIQSRHSEGYRRGRAQSATTATSSATDADRRSMLSSQRRSDNLRRAPISSYINLDAAGGVGDSPMPPQRTPTSPSSANQTSTNRTSMANFFFGRPLSSSSKKLSRSPSTQNLVRKHRESRPISSIARKSTSLDMPRSRSQGPVLAIETRTHPTSDNDYYNSYYSTLLPTSKPVGVLGRRDSQPTATSAKLSAPGAMEDFSSRASLPETHRHPSSVHPYSYSFPVKHESIQKASPQTAPPTVGRSATFSMLPARQNLKDSALSSSHQNHRNPAQTLMGTKRPAGTLQTTNGPSPTSLIPLKSTVSTPNLRRGQLTQSPVSPQLPKGMDRWFSAESWCDAMILPRPRFKVNNGPGDTDIDSAKRGDSKGIGRIVSPPLTPIARSEHGADKVELKTFPERREQITEESDPKPPRKLIKSKSVTSLKSTGASINPTFPGPSITILSADHHRADSKGKAKLYKRRPRDLVLDDVDLEAEPSLNRVLNEGDLLEEQRQQWHAQATKSLGNKATRSLSRRRAKSLNYKDSRRRRKNPSHTMGSIDFLTARTLLGSQGIAPSIVVRTSGSQGAKTESRTGTVSSKSHSHSNSHGTQSSQGGHRRTDSWGQHALKLAKYTASGALCGLQDQSHTNPTDEKAAAVESAIKGTDTQYALSRDQREPQEEESFVVVDKTLFAAKDVAPVSSSVEDFAVGPSGMGSGSPTPSATTGHGVGIALSTPPPSDDHSREMYETMSMPDHPYAHGAEYSYHLHKPAALELVHGSNIRVSDFAGPHPSSPTLSDFNVDANDMSIRHRLPPQATLQSLPHMAHPYAMGSNPAKLRGNPKSVVDQNDHEPRTTDIGFDASDSHLAHAYARLSTGNQEPLCVGEALNSFRRQSSRDTGFDVEEIHSVAEDQAASEAAKAKRSGLNSRTWPLRIRRKPVSYVFDDDNVSPASPEPEAANAFADPVDTHRAASSSTVGNSSGSSLQDSPRPLGNVDDLDHFHDLFYEPDHSNPVASSSTSHRPTHLVVTHDVFPLDVNSSRSIRSGLSSLARKLTEEYEDRISQEVPDEVDSNALTQGQRYGSHLDQSSSNIAIDHEFIFPDQTRAASPGPMDSALPLHLGSDETGPDDNVPENVGSSRASSILQASSDDDDTFGQPPRLRAVSVNTPPAIVNDHQALRHISFVADQVEIEDDALDAEPELREGETQGSLAPPAVSADPTRSSYMTITTDGSRMSGLSDFPEPPPVEHLTPAHMSIINSYFGGGTSHKPIEDSSNNQPAISENLYHANHRMTFGGSEDAEGICDAPESPEL